ncbi:L-aspartate oxidase [Azospirillaceae bacterium]
MVQPRIQTTETLIIGSGMAGLIAALSLAPRPVALLTKTDLLEGGSSPMAQGGMAAAVAPDDSVQDHAADTVAAGAGLTDEAMAMLLAADGAAALREILAERSLPFDRAPDGTPLFGQEAAHRRPRILHAGGDATGRTLVLSLIEQVKRTPSITIYPGAFAVDLILENGRPRGVLAHHHGIGWIFHQCADVVLASGGVGATYLHTTNPPENTADGLAMAARAGATLADLEFLQFHPTALAVPGADPERPMPLLTEALRGAGAPLLDRNGRRFMLEEHPAAELAPRDVVARAVWRQITSGAGAFLDCRTIFADPHNREHFPTVWALTTESGLDPRAAPLPIAPAAHYHMGGVLTDENGRTSLPGLWACGEVAGVGVHGANRLASNSLLEGLVFGARVARAIAAQPHSDRLERAATPLSAATTITRAMQAAAAVGATGAEGCIQEVVSSIRRVMYENVGLVRNENGLQQAALILADLDRQMTEAVAAGVAFGPPSAEAVRRWGEARNRLLFARLMTLGASNRRESRGAHERSDYPRQAADWRRRQFLRIDDLTHATPLPEETRLAR